MQRNRMRLGCSTRFASTLAISIALSALLPVDGAAQQLTPPGIVKEKPAGRCVAIKGGYMVPYQQRIPGTDQLVWMEPIPGRAANDKSRGVALEPFWMARYETRHGDYLPYMRLYSTFIEFEQRRVRQVTDKNEIDAVTAPTEIYDVSFAFEFGMDMDQPVGTMTLLGARQYTKWLSKLTKRDFRLPTAAEWEHACRGGTSTPWHCGDDPSVLKEYAVFGDPKSTPGYQSVGGKKPNAWGLYDMHGNLAEWVLQPGVTDVDKQILMGGCWEFPAERCQSDSKLKFENEAFRSYDPMLPQSPWWLASDESRWVGFRIMRPLKPMTAKERHFAWECHTKEEREAVKDQLKHGRGVLGLVDPELPAAIERLEAAKQKERGGRKR